MRRTLALAGMGAVVVTTTIAAPAAAQPSWAPADQATIHPGVATYTDEAQCTANFVFTNGTDVFLGQAAHCGSLDDPTVISGCEAASQPLGTPVEVGGASRPGELVYSSWLTMRERGETDPAACMFNDFALVRLDPADVPAVNPSIPVWGGPSGVDPDGTQPNDIVYGFGNSDLRPGLGFTNPKIGVSLGTSDAGWNHTVYTVTPGIPGDSGSPVLSQDGEALGVASTLAALPLPASNGIGDLRRALDYANAHGGLGTITLVPGTEPFTPLL